MGRRFMSGVTALCCPNQGDDQGLLDPCPRLMTFSVAGPVLALLRVLLQGALCTPFERPGGVPSALCMGLDGTQKPLVTMRLETFRGNLTTNLRKKSRPGLLPPERQRKGDKYTDSFVHSTQKPTYSLEAAKRNVSAKHRQSYWKRP